MKRVAGGDLWIVGRVDVNRLPQEQLQEAMRWVASHGVNPAQVRGTIAISQDGRTGVLRLHCSRMVTDSSGDLVPDHAASTIQTEPLIVSVPDFPTWFPVVWQEQKTLGLVP